MKEEISELLEKLGFFNPIIEYIDPAEPIVPNEKVIGEMNPLEKSLYSLFVLKEKEHGELITKIKECSDPIRLKELYLEHENNHYCSDLAKKMMRSSVRNRVEVSEESEGIGLREGFQLVELPKRKPKPNSFQELMETLFS
jgi:hypothetical protein